MWGIHSSRFPLNSTGSPTSSKNDSYDLRRPTRSNTSQNFFGLESRNQPFGKAKSSEPNLQRLCVFHVNFRRGAGPSAHAVPAASPNGRRCPPHLNSPSVRSRRLAKGTWYGKNEATMRTQGPSFLGVINGYHPYIGGEKNLHCFHGFGVQRYIDILFHIY